jgi:hypothetical protein
MSERATVLLARYSCYAQLLCTAAMNSCYTQLLCSADMHSWYAQQICTAAINSWYAELLCRAAMQSCYAELLCTATIHSRNAQLICTAITQPFRYTGLWQQLLILLLLYIGFWAWTVKPSKFNICVSSSLISINVCKEIGLVFSFVYIFGWVAR